MRTRINHTAMLLALLGAAAGNAVAMQQSSEEREQAIVDELFDSIVVAPDDEALAQTTNKSSSTYTMNGNGHNVIVRIIDGKVSCKVDGKTVDPDRVKKEADRIIVLDGDDQQIAVFRVAGPGTSFAPAGSTIKRGVPLQWRNSVGSGSSFAPKAEAVSPPDVMVGLMMGEPGESLLQHFGLEEGQAIMVTEAIEGLPAAKAGIRAGDLIVAIEGESPATPATLQKALKDLDAGDPLRMHVIQKGQKKEIKIKVAAYDPEALSVGSDISIATNSPNVFTFNWDEEQNAQQQSEMLHRRAEELARRMREHGGRAPEDLDVMREYIEELAEHNAKRDSELRLRIQPNIGERLQNFVVPRGLGVNNDWDDKLESRLDQLHDEMDRLSDELEHRIEERMAHLEAMIDKLVSRLEDDGNRRRGSREREN